MSRFVDGSPQGHHNPVRQGSPMEREMPTPGSIPNPGMTETPTPSTPATIAVITATIGHRHLGRCLASVQAQSLVAGVEHVVVIDGPEHETRVREAAGGAKADRVARRVVVLPHPTGPDGYN